MSQALQYLDLYLQRLGYDAPPAPTLDTLRELQRRHTATFAFETLATFLGEPVPIDLASLQRKVLHEGRGGYCYELNRLFLALLQDLGFVARGLTARVVMGGPEEAPTARTHMFVLATLDGLEYLADVGFGGMVPTAPLRLDTQAPQSTPHEDYRLARIDGGYALRAKVGEEWRPMYVFDLTPAQEVDYVVGNWYVSTHPESPFQGRMFAARTGDGIRKTLSDGSYAVHRLGQPSQRRELADADEVMAVLRDELGIRIADAATLRAAIVKRLAERETS
ncbi:MULTISPECIES: arylamine N-acetyltransferase [unclassified Lysobacter]|uniref:arylamine N-acetyltransferase family protein n=1 Tax=unclassified Lysobacter TaxID=2635362 RepID=UPI00070EE7F9|nr:MULTISPECIES: arylamine N-acetyltransferase [unclassified Lysobacter]KRD32041.1 N-hydroxyarylamine O-acetyltransferase [Lysobacter sp. Root916]KRD75913.1 N-hydroxyarylamine O-acetyltransferase [Lysobacter sp. Root983]